VGERKNPQNEIIAEPEELYFTDIGRKTLVQSRQNFALGDIREISTFDNFGVDRLWGCSVARKSNFRLLHKLSPYVVRQHRYTSGSTLRLCAECLKMQNIRGEGIVVRKMPTLD